MMKHKNWWFLAFSLLCFLRLGAQTVSQTWASALLYEEKGKYQAALAKFERIKFFKPDTLVCDIYIHTGNCRMYAGAYYKAISDFDNALLADLHKTRQNTILIQRLKAEVLAHNMRLALLTIRDIDTIKDNKVRDQVVFYKGVICFFKEEYPEAEQNWARLVQHDPAKLQQIHKLFKENKRVNRLKPGVAIALSIILPGAGQIYAGDIKDGLNSLLLMGGLFVLGYNTAVAYNIYNALIAVGPWYLRYYQGGFTKAGQLVLEKRAQKHQAIYSKILETLK